jgi:hypothetical protein
MAEPSGSCSSAVSHSLASAQEVLEATRAGGISASGASVHSSPSLLAPSAAAQQRQLVSCSPAEQHPQQDQQHSEGMQPQQQQHQQHEQQIELPSIAEQASSMQRLGGALQGVLSSGLSSDYVEGLKPVMLNGSLQISTHIQLAGEAEPVFIGMFPTLQAAVDAQKQSQALVSKVPASNSCIEVKSCGHLAMYLCI